MKLGIMLFSNDLETISNAFELAVFALKRGDQVKVCLIGKGVEAAFISKTEAYAKQPFRVIDQMQAFAADGGQVLASHKCLAARELRRPPLCTQSTTADIYEAVAGSDKIITF